MAQNFARGGMGVTGFGGITGTNGITGLPGIQGLTGLVGITGFQAPTGVIGLTGTIGITGQQGIVGLTGTIGITGAQAPTGVIGLTGSVGITGVVGLTGAIGITGQVGITGTIGITGQQGIVGLTGAIGITGFQAPTGVIGLTGQQGIQGPTGVVGLTGSIGITGVVGITGQQGNQGLTGLWGITGLFGITGVIGITGASGIGGGGGGGSSGFIVIDPAKYSQTPPSTSTITMLADMTATIFPGYALRYKVSGVYYYGICTTITSNLLTLNGAALSTASNCLTELYYATQEILQEVVLFVGGRFASAADNTSLQDNQKTFFIWMTAVAYLVKFYVRAAINDSGGTQPNVNISIAGNAVSTSNTNAGIALGNGWTQTAIDINSANYAINYGNALEVQVDNSGQNKDAENLTISCLFVYYHS